MANEDCLKVTGIFISLAIIALSITSLVFLFMVYDDAKKSEPADRTKYIDYDEITNEYVDLDDDYCTADNYQSYIDNGGFKDFDIRMKNIKKFSLALIVLNFISLGLEILTIIILVSVALCCENSSGDSIACVIVISAILKILCSLLAFIFFIITSVNYFKSDFEELETFSKFCLNKKKFERDYKFVFDVKDNYLKYFIIYFIIFALNIIDNAISRLKKKE